MKIEDIKREIEQRAGVPASLLTGETVEENIAQAKALLAYKREYEQQRPKTTAEQFGAWVDAQLGKEPQEPQDAAGAALAEIEEAARRDAGGYPIVPDGGQIDISRLPDARPAREQFADWFKKETAFDPFKDPDGWTRIL